MTNEEREKKTRIANMLIGTIKDLRTPMLMYQVEKDVAKEALENYIKALEEEPAEWIVDIDDSRRWDRVRFYCSACNGWNTYGKSKYCPNCGRRMQSEEH